MGPEVVGPVALEGGEGVEVLELGKGEEGWGGEDVDAQDGGEAVLVEVEGVLEGEEAETVAVHHACIIDDIDVGGGPAGSDVADDDLLEEAPIAGETDEEGGGFGDVGGGGLVPLGDWGEVGGGGGTRRQGEVVEDWRGGCWLGLVEGLWLLLCRGVCSGFE